MKPSLDTYRVPVKGLTEGKHDFSFTLDISFFACFEETKELEGLVDVVVGVKKNHTLVEAKVNMEGSLTGTCDRCLESVDFPFSANAQLLIKQDGVEEDNFAENVIIMEDDEYADFAEKFYEILLTNLPYKIVHPEKNGQSKCNETMVKKIEELSQKKNTIDPRWKNLKKLIK